MNAPRPAASSAPSAAIGPVISCPTVAAPAVVAVAIGLVVAGVTALALVVALRRPTPARLVSLTRPGAPVLAETVANGRLRLGLYAAPVHVQTVPARQANEDALSSARPAVLRIVYADHVIVNSDLSGFAHAEMTTAQDQEAAEVAGAAAEIAAGSGVPYTFERRLGAPADAILSSASAQAADGDSEPVIVVGRSRHATRHVLGSVPVRLLHHSPYPVLAVP